MYRNRIPGLSLQVRGKSIVSVRRPNPLLILLSVALLHRLPATRAATCSRAALGGLSQPPLGLAHSMTAALIAEGGVVQFRCDKTQNLYVSNDIVVQGFFLLT